MKRENIGSLFVIGYQGIEPSDEFLRFVEEWKIGGVIVFARNISSPEDVSRAIRKIENAAGQRIFAAIDQEGGLVMRLLQGCSLFQSAMGLAATGDLKLVEASYAALGKEMLALGLNWNLAPVLDINHPDNPGIGARSFGDDAKKVAEYGCAAIRGLQSAGVLACAKHFPGKGNARVDSHLTLPIIDSSEEQLFSHELLPFTRAIEDKVAAIMTAHVFFPAFETAQDLPATLSESVLTGLLRNRLGYEGLLITDDLEMGAITEKFGIAEAAARSFVAGADLMLICHQLGQQKEAAERILSLCKADAAAAKRLEQSLARINHARSLFSKPADDDLAQLCCNHRELISATHERALRFINLDKTALLVNKDEELLVVFPEIASLVQVEETHSEGGAGRTIKERFSKATVVEYNPKSPASEIIDRVKAKWPATRIGNLLFFSYNAHLFAGQVEAANILAGLCQNATAIALRNPYDLSKFKGFKNRGATFSFRTPAIVAILDALSGNFEPFSQPWPVDVKNW